MQLDYSITEYLQFQRNMKQTTNTYCKEKTTKSKGKNIYSEKMNHNIHISYMCEDCFSLFPAKVKFRSKLSMQSNSKLNAYSSVIVAGSCPICKKWTKVIEIDYNIANAIQILNQKGYFTKFCCEGHTEPYIMFEFKEDVFPFLNELPFTWYIDYRSLKDGVYTANPGCIIIRADRYNYSESLYDILVWAKALPFPKWLDTPPTDIGNLF